MKEQFIKKEPMKASAKELSTIEIQYIYNRFSSILFSIMFVLPEAQLFHIVRKKLKRTPVHDFFKGKNVLLIMGVGAFTATDDKMIKEFEGAYDDLCKEFDLDDILYLTMNDPFCLDAWGKSLKIKKVKLQFRNYYI